MPSETFRASDGMGFGKTRRETKNNSVLPLLAVPSAWFAVLPPYFQNMTQVFHVFFLFFPITGSNGATKVCKSRPKVGIMSAKAVQNGILSAAHQNIATVLAGRFPQCAKQVLSRNEEEGSQTCRRPFRMRISPPFPRPPYEAGAAEPYSGICLPLKSAPVLCWTTNARPIYAPPCSTGTERRTANRFSRRSICCWGLWVRTSGIRKGVAVPQLGGQHTRSFRRILAVARRIPSTCSPMRRQRVFRRHSDIGTGSGRACRHFGETGHSFRHRHGYQSESRRLRPCQYCPFGL